jgi:2-oxoglutarate ferredoxin oxidoreductase subunit alpha
MTRELLKGNQAFAEAAVRAGVEAYFGYPITPQTEGLEWMSTRMVELGRAFVQAESELAAINMVYGAACTGARVMTSSSSPGISLMMEGISYIAGTELPVVLVDVMRGGPGLGNIAPAQADYNQMVHGGGHGDYHPIVLAPATVQELIDMTYESFDLAEKYRAIVVVLLDGSLGQMMEPAELPAMRPIKTDYPDWSTRGNAGRKSRFHTSIYMDPPLEEKANIRMMKRWQEIQKNETRWLEYFMDDAEYAVTAFGTVGRIALSAVRMAREVGIKVGLIRPTVLNPFPYQAYEKAAKQVKSMLTVEMSGGQMLDDVIRGVKSSIPVEFYGRIGGVMPLPDEVFDEIKRLADGKHSVTGDPRIGWLERLDAMVN